ncbi:sigma-70 family RNA polymerase sigma factor [Falsibacillus albus]|uniref:Sigma-70 family RNA polymerase sigma factor n=1 Tax=Falsibacillus albus TaxID=2478915 RepID=A0A3L7JK15_9BACI|nr:sigma-70 family RNA polymerase sigma factor [Falsibacillus albus]RLQ91138.1 sigma-70 family RNA polymerase sigma factor [Falsibacillus albus]
MDQLKIIKKAKKGDHEAFYQLMQSHKERLYRIAYSYLKSEADALEAIQETTFRAYRFIKKLKKPEFFSTWLIRILINYCNDELKKRNRIVFSDQVIETAGSKEDLYPIEIEEAINSLDEKYRQVITMKYLHDLKIKEIAMIMDSPEGTIKTWLAKGLRLLKQDLGRKGDVRDA